MLKWLVAVDGSEPSERALDHVVALAQRIDGLEAVLVNVQAEPEFRVLALHRDEILAELKAAGEAILAPAGARLAEAGVEVETRVETGEPASVIARLAVETGADGMVMGTRGLAPMTGLLLGSVATKVLHLVQIPVTLVR